MSPPIINESEEEEGYFEIDTSSIGLAKDDEEAGEKFNNLNNNYGGEDSDLSSELSEEEEERDQVDEEEGIEDEEEEEEEDDEEEEEEEEEDDDEEHESTDVEEGVDETASKNQVDDEEEETEDEMDEEEAEEDEEEIPSISDEEDNYNLEDPDEIDDDLELRDEEEEEPQPVISKKAVATKPTSRTRTSTRTKVEIPATTRETRKRQLTFYEEDDDDLDEYDEIGTPKRQQLSRKARRIPEPQLQPQDLDEDLILTDEEQEYNPHANPDLSKMTERQRARFLEEVDNKKKFVELDDNFTSSKKAKPKKKETEEEIALRKAENARKRQDYKMKVLEEEKRDTLNKLLKRRATKTREIEQKEGSTETSKSPLKPRRPMLEHPVLSRYVSNTTSLNGNSILGLNS